MSDLTPDQPNNIIALHPGFGDELEITKKKIDAYKKCPGRHKNVEVDSEARTLTCRNCGFVIDAFDYVEAWAHDGAARMRGLQEIEHKRKIAALECADLERKITNARGVLKRTGCPQPAKEKLGYNVRRWNPHHEGTEWQEQTPDMLLQNEPNE